MKSKRQNRNAGGSKRQNPQNAHQIAVARAKAEEARIKEGMKKEEKQPPEPLKEAQKQGGMKLSRAKDLLEFGVLLGAEIVENPMGAGWLLQMKGRSGETHTLETDRGGLRVFKTLDATFKLCEEIGFEKALVCRKRSLLHVR